MTDLTCPECGNKHFYIGAGVGTYRVRCETCAWNVALEDVETVAEGLLTH